MAKKIDNSKFIIEAPKETNAENNPLERLESAKCVEFLAHKDTITCLNFIDLKERLIVTGSIDSFIRVWRTDG